MTEAEQARALGDIYALFLRGASYEAEQVLLSDPLAERLDDGDAQGEPTEPE